MFARLSLFCTLFTLAFGMTTAAQSDQPRLITVSGEAVVPVEPDLLSIDFNVTSLESSLEASRQRTDSIISRIRLVCDDMGIADEDVRTTYVDMRPVYRNKNGESILEGYRASSTMRVTLKNIDAYETLVTRVLAEGVYRIDDVNFRISNPRVHMDEARAMALRAAREEAEDMAAVLGVKTGRVWSIQEGGSYVPYYSASTFNVAADPMMSGGSGQYAIAGGTVELTARVSVQFELEE